MPFPANNDARAMRHVVVGRIVGTFGTRGWVKVRSFTRPPEGVLEYERWHIGVEPHWRDFQLGDRSSGGRSLRAQLQGIDDCESARALVGSDVAIERSQLPELPPGQHYWCDLIGLEVLDQHGASLGAVVEIWETGANDVLVVEGAVRTLIPFVPGRFIKAVDLKRQRIDVDWVPGHW